MSPLACQASVVAVEIKRFGTVALEFSRREGEEGRRESREGEGVDGTVRANSSPSAGG